MDQTGQESLEYGYLTGNILCYNYKYDTAREEYADYSYDNNGNLSSKTGVPVNITNTYDGFNRLISSAAGENPVSLSYEYNGDGLRTAKTAKGTRTEFIWVGDRLVCEISGESVTVYKYGNRLFGFEKDGVKKYYNFNGHGDVTGITNSSYSQIKSYEYDAFGVEKNPDPADTNPFRYCAEYYDAETGYIYLRARYYDVKDGRFISEDPHWNVNNMIYGDNENTHPDISVIIQSTNLYVYCINNPIKYRDPSGHILPGDKYEFGEHSDTYKILVDLGNRWWQYNVATRNQYSNLANEVRRLARAKTPIQYAQNKVINQIHANAKVATDYQSNMINGISGILYQLQGNNYIEDSTTFLIGMAYGKWNYKQNPNWQVPYPYFNGKNMNVDNNKNWQAWMYFDGMLMAGDDFGNLNMAYVGYKMGLPEYIYKNFATTDGKDAFWVQYGISLAKCGR